MALRPLHIAITGHRLNQLPEEDRPRLRGEIAEVFSSVEAAAAEGCDGPVRLTLVSAIAEGADRYAAHAAVARGWRLITPLPFQVDRYLQDFSDEESKREFMTYLKLSERVWIVTPEQVAAAGGGGAAPYAAVARELIQKADLLLAVWNGKPPAGPGGTAEVAALALEAGVAVAWLPVGSAAPVSLILPAKLARRGSARRGLLDALANRIPRTEQPEAMRRA
jgi:hypothetical protein